MLSQHHMALLRLVYAHADDDEDVDLKTFDDLSGHADPSLFSSVLCNPNHILGCLLHPAKNVTYSLCTGSHNCETRCASALT